MANPIGGQNKANMNDEIAKILETPATETPAVEAAKEVAGATAPTTPATEEKQQYEYTDATTALIGKIDSARINNNANIESTALGLAMKEFGKASRIVGYCCRTDAKIDFKRIVTKPKTEGADATYVYNLAMTGPSKPDRVIVKFPLDLYTTIENRKGEITTKDVKEMGALMDSESAFALKIFRVGKNDHTLFDWVNTHFIEPYINEAEEIFVPYTKINSKGEAEVRENYIGEAAYATTGEKPGLRMSCRFESNTSAQKVLGNVTRIDVLKEGAAELKVKLTHTGRPKWVAPGNYIVDKKFATIPGAVPTETSQQIEMSKCYFRRWFSESLADGEKRSTDHINKGIKYQAQGQIKVNAVSEDQFTATPFTDASYWANASVQHWYDVTVENGKPVRRTLTGSEIQLVERFSKVNQNTGKITYANKTLPLTADGVADSAYTWSTAIPDNVKAAMGTAADSLTFELYKKSMHKVGTVKKASARCSVDFNLTGQNFEQLQKLLADTMGAAATSKFQ